MCAGQASNKVANQSYGLFSHLDFVYFRLPVYAVLPTGAPGVPRLRLLPPRP